LKIETAHTQTHLATTIGAKSKAKSRRNKQTFAAKHNRKRKQKRGRGRQSEGRQTSLRGWCRRYGTPIWSNRIVTHTQIPLFSHTRIIQFSFQLNKLLYSYSGCSI